MARAQPIPERRRRKATKKPSSKPSATKRASANVINLRVDSETRALIDRARNALGQNRTEFMLASARVRAQEVLLRQTHFTLSGDDWLDFQAALEAPPVPTAELVALMASKPPWSS